MRFYPTDNKGWMCGITDEQLKALMSITTLFTHPAKTLTEVESYLSNNAIKESVINCCGEDVYESIDDVWWRLLANDLLRKAQEK